MIPFYFTCSDGAAYVHDEYGIHQVNPKPFTYDEAYCAIYDDPDRVAKSNALQAARLGFIMGAYGSTPYSILDYGCGNFAFLNEAKKLIPNCYGYDVADYPVPDGIEMVKYDGFFKRDVFSRYDVICFNDALEHIPDLNFIYELKCDMITVSLPNRRNVDNNYDGDYYEWFDRHYFHRKKDEHIHHYTLQELINTMNKLGWEHTTNSIHEDLVRVRRGRGHLNSCGYQSNIISAAFKR